MALQQDVEDLVSESLNGYGLVKRLLEDYSDLRSRASFELQARQRFFEKGFIPELRTYIRTITSISDMSQADLTDLLQQHEQARQRSIQENQAVVAELQEASRELNSALQSYGADMQEADYNRGVYSISRIMQHSKWQPINLGNVVKSLDAMKGIATDIGPAVDKRYARQMVAYFRDLTGYGKEVLEEAKRHGQEPYRGDIKPEIIAKALFERYAEVDLSLYKEPLWERFKQGVGKTVQGIRERRAERRQREPEPEMYKPQVSWMPAIPDMARRRIRPVHEEYMPIRKGPAFGARLKKAAMARAKEIAELNRRDVIAHPEYYGSDLSRRFVRFFVS